MVPYQHIFTGTFEELPTWKCHLVAAWGGTKLKCRLEWKWVHFAL